MGEDNVDVRYRRQKCATNWSVGWKSGVILNGLSRTGDGTSSIRGDDSKGPFQSYDPHSTLLGCELLL